MDILWLNVQIKRITLLVIQEHRLYKYKSYTTGMVGEVYKYYRYADTSVHFSRLGIHTYNPPYHFLILAQLDGDIIHAHKLDPILVKSTSSM